MKARYLDRHVAEALGREKCSLPIRKTAAALDRREAERVPLRTYVSYVTDERMGLSRGQGWLVDLSKTGCKIAGPALMLGTSVTVVLYFQDDKDPFCVCGATVTWCNGNSFGLRFPKLNGAERHRLQELVLRFASFRGNSEGHTAFRLA